MFRHSRKGKGEKGGTISRPNKTEKKKNRGRLGWKEKRLNAPTICITNEKNLGSRTTVLWVWGERLKESTRPKTLFFRFAVEKFFVGGSKAKKEGRKKYNAIIAPFVTLQNSSKEKEKSNSRERAESRGKLRATADGNRRGWSPSLPKKKILEVSFRTGRFCRRSQDLRGSRESEPQNHNT